MKTINRSLFLLFLPFLVSCITSSTSVIVIDNGNVKYEVSKKGVNLYYTDKKTGTDYLYSDTVSYCSYIQLDGKEYHVTSVSQKDDILFLEFDDTGVTAEIKIGQNKHNYSTLEVVGISGDAESLTFLNIPLKLDGMPDESFATCALSMNLFTRVHQLPALQTNLQASCYKRFGMKGAKITLVGTRQENVLPVIREVLENSDDIPYSTKGGAWAQMQKEGYGSYLMNFGTLTENTVDEWIQMCNGLGFNQIDNHGGGKFFKFGDFELNKEKWPDGWDSFKRINKRLHDAGISSIFHTYAFFIDKNSKYVSPVPHPDLDYFDSFTLAKPIGEKDDEIVVNETTENISTITGFFVRNSVTLRIGNELIKFTGVTDSPPYKFTGCQRGINGTTASSHERDEKAYHLKEMFGRFVPNPNSALFKDIAENTADIVNKCGFDGLYFDAIDGSDILGGNEYSWYYGTKFIFEVAKNLDRSVGMEMSTMFHHWWHYRSRWQAYDRPVRGYKRFIDIHAATIKSHEYIHGNSQNHTALLEKYANAENGSLMLPLHLGWWGNQTWNPPQVEPTMPDDIEYLCCKMMGNNAGLSMLGEADEETFNKKPLFRRLAGIVKQYEELRHKNYFNDSIRALLRQPGKEFSLFQQEDGSWNFKPVNYQKHKVAGLEHSTSQWNINNEFSAQPAKLRIEPLMSVKPYDDPDNIILADYGGEIFVKGDSAEGVSGKIAISEDKTENGETACAFYGQNTGKAPDNSSWIGFEKELTPVLNLQDKKGLGVWVKGDGNGQLLNLRLESPKHISHGARGDHFIKIDFTGWKYFELIEIESTSSSDYNWPDNGDGFYLYDSYRHTVSFKNINKLQFWYNNLSGGKEAKCLIGPVKAIPLVPTEIENPAVTINGEKIIFPVKMESGMWLEFNSAEDCKLYSPQGKLLQEVKIKGKIPFVKQGENKISFSGRNVKKTNARVQVTVLTEGNPL